MQENQVQPQRIAGSSATRRNSLRAYGLATIKPKKSKNRLKKRMPKKIWANFMEASLKDEPVKYFKETNNVIGVYINPASGKLATERCPISRLTYFVKGTEPQEYCPEHFQGDPLKGEPDQQKKLPWYKRLLKPWG